MRSPGLERPECRKLFLFTRGFGSDRLIRLRKRRFQRADTEELGLFEAAHPGTVFLDAIRELDPEDQAKQKEKQR
jgi:hypothetical protein